MKSFTIENETNNITIHVTVQDAEAVANAERFRNEAGLGKLAADWPAARLVDVWNSLPGATPVKKFKDRATAVNRIWKAIQGLGGAIQAETTNEPEVSSVMETARGPEIAAAMPETAPVDPEPEPLLSQPIVSESPEAKVATTVAPQTPDVAPEETPAKNRATSTKNTPANAGTPREGSKTSQVIAMLKREGGTTLEEIMTAMGWQKHTTRAMLSAGGSLTKNHGLVITSEKVGEKRTYSIKA